MLDEATLARVVHDTGYLPSGPSMARSEFMLPLDADTAAMYRRLLAPGGWAAPADSTGAPSLAAPDAR